MLFQTLKTCFLLWNVGNWTVFVAIDSHCMDKNTETFLKISSCMFYRRMSYRFRNCMNASKRRQNLDFWVNYHFKNVRWGHGLNMSLLLHQTPLLSDVLTVDFTVFLTGDFISVYIKGLDFALMMECLIWSHVLLLKTQTIQQLIWKTFKTWM